MEFDYQLQFFQMFSFKTLKNTFLQIDLFYTNELLKYRSDNNYKTMPGAIVSLALTVAILIGFSSMIISMFEKTTIEASVEANKIQDPEYIKLSSESNNFMFGILVQNRDLTKVFDLIGPQYFDIGLIGYTFDNGIPISFKPIILQSCTRQHWKKISSLEENFDNLQVGKWLCPQLNFTMELEGLSTSSKYQSSVLSIRNCTNSTRNGNKCAPQEQIDAVYNQYGNFVVRLSFINPIINPSKPNPNHISYYLQVKNVMVFSSTLGAQMNIDFSDYQINTDGTILPLPIIETQKGYIVEDLSRAVSYSLKSGQRLGIVYFVKSSNKLTYTRTVLKISAVISYVGGLIGALITVLFMLKSHTQFSYLMALSTDLFVQKTDQNKGDQIKSLKKKFDFGLLRILKFYFYRIKFFFTNEYGDESELMKKMERCQKQIQKQLDIKVLLQRLIKLEQCVCFLFDKAQIEDFKHTQQITLQRTQFLRNKLHGTDQMQAQELEEKQNQKPQAQPNNQHQDSQNSGIALNRIQSLAVADQESPFQNGRKYQKGQFQSNIIEKKIYQEIHPNIKSTVQQIIVEDIQSAKLVDQFTK